MTQMPLPSASPKVLDAAAPASRWKRLLPLAVLGTAVVAAYMGGAADYLSLDRLVAARETLRAWVADHPIGAPLLYMAIYAIAVALSLPGAVVLTIAGGFLFGTLTGTLVTVMAATVGATLVFLVARTAFGSALRAKAGPFIGKLADGFAADAFNYLLSLRLVPLFPFWLVNLAPALLDVKLKTFVAATFIGIIPGTAAFTSIGAGLDSVVEAQRAANPACAGGAACEITLNVGSLVTPQLLIAFALLGVVALIPVAWKRWRAARA
jgi:uncharacterized membrane protein YdjX (TVP38/TMEM64 family)